MPEQPRENLHQAHQPAQIRKRLQAEPRSRHVGDLMLGAIDGGITSFAVVAGAVGGGFGNLVVVILGFASLFADGFSMAVSNYLSRKSDAEDIDRAQQEELRHSREVPAGQREELRQIFIAKGLNGEILEEVVDTLSADQQLWATTVIQEEFGLIKPASSQPLKAGTATFAAFIAAGVVPLMPFVWPGWDLDTSFQLSILITSGLFLIIGMIKGWALDQRLTMAGMETLFNAGGAALLAYGVGWLLRSWLNQTVPV